MSLTILTVKKMEDNDSTITSNDVTVILNDGAMGGVLRPENKILQKETLSDSSTVKTGARSKKKRTGKESTNKELEYGQPCKPFGYFAGSFNVRS